MVSKGRLMRDVSVHAMVLAACMLVLSYLPFVPYNVRELYATSSPLLTSVLLSITVFWICGVPALAAHWLTTAGLRGLALPLVLALHALAAWAMLRLAVPLESIHDVVGSPVLDWPWESEYIARMVPLVSAVALPLSAGSVLAMLLQGRPVRLAPLSLLASFAIAGPLQYFVIVRRAGTDNLTELMADGAGPLSFALLLAYALLVGTVGSTLAFLRERRGRSRWVLAPLLLAGSLPLGYVLLQAGTESVIVKYGQVFSAMQFLFSASRDNLASSTDLLARFSVFHLAAALLVAWMQAPFSGVHWQPGRSGRRPG